MRPCANSRSARLETDLVAKRDGGSNMEHAVFGAPASMQEAMVVRTGDGGVTWTPLGMPCRGLAGLHVATIDAVHVWMVCPPVNERA